MMTMELLCFMRVHCPLLLHLLVGVLRGLGALASRDKCDTQGKSTEKKAEMGEEQGEATGL